jgi:hypothetical protein
MTFSAPGVAPIVILASIAPLASRHFLFGVPVQGQWRMRDRECFHINVLSPFKVTLINLKVVGSNRTHAAIRVMLIIPVEVH